MRFAYFGVILLCTCLVFYIFLEDSDELQDILKMLAHWFLGHCDHRTNLH